MNGREEQMRRDANVAEGRRFVGDIGAGLREHVQAHGGPAAFAEYRPPEPKSPAKPDIEQTSRALYYALGRVTGEDHQKCVELLRELLTISEMLDEVTTCVSARLAIRDMQAKIAETVGTFRG